MEARSTTTADAPRRWIKVLDQNRCIGCHACTTACKSENSVPVGVTRTYVKSVDVGTYPQVRRAFQVTRCNQCSEAPCVAACPTAAMYRREDGIVDFDKTVCIGCKACIAACPYDAIFINPEDNSAEKCNFCAHRLEVGLEPACVTVCPTEAILVGDLHDPTSAVAQIVERQPVAVRRPEKETRPGLFYKGAHQATLDPLAAERPSGGLFAWAGQGDFADPGLVITGTPGPSNLSVPAQVSYDIPHHAPWGWRVSLYTFTKGVAAGALGLAVVLGFLGRLPFASDTMRLGAPALALGFLGLTGFLLTIDLKHPKRFYLIFTRRQWRSWLVRGAVVLSAYGALASAFLLVGILGATGALGGGAASAAERVLGGLGVAGALGTACYTAYLFAQAAARDLWQSPLLPLQLALQATLAGAGVLWPLAAGLGAPPGTRTALEVVLSVTAGLHLLVVTCELSLAHPSAHAHRAATEMWKGRFASWFWGGVALLAVAIAAPVIGVAAAPCALLGLAAYEHAYVQAGQSVPLA